MNPDNSDTLSFEKRLAPDSTFAQAAEHMNDFKTTGKIDPTIGVNDDVLWNVATGCNARKEDGVSNSANHCDGGAGESPPSSSVGGRLRQMA